MNESNNNFKQIILISSNYKNPLVVKSTNIFCIDYGELIDGYSLKYDNRIYYFDYLIFDDLKLVKNLNIRLEHKKALTNYYLQTSIENIFAIGDANASVCSSLEDLERVIEYLTEGE